MSEGQGIDAGDAVLTFLGDTTSMDAAFDKVALETQTKLEPTNVKLKEVAGNWQFTGQAASTAGEAAEVAGDEIVDAANRSAAATREAKGEAALLGEAFGVHLPRHVRSFLAELPGVSEALTAAFSATAILFLIQAVVEITNKITEFGIAHFILTEEMKKSTAEVIAANVELVKQAEAFAKAQQAVEDWGKNGVELAADKVTKLTSAIAAQEAAMRQAQDNLYGYRNGLLELSESQVRANQQAVTIAAATIKALNEQLDEANLQSQKAQEEAMKAHLTAQIALRKTVGEAVFNLQEAQAKEEVAGTMGAADKKLAIEESFEQKRFQLKLQSLQKELQLEQQYGGKDNSDKIKQIEAQIDAVREEYAAKQATRLEKEKDELAKTLQGMAQDVKNVLPQLDIILPENVQKILTMRAAAQSLGITLKGDLYSALEQAKAAKEAFVDAGGKDLVALKAFDNAILTAQHNVDNYGKSLDKLKLKGETTFRGLVQDLKQGVDVTHELSAAGIQAFDQLSKSLEGAIAGAILGQKNFGKALEEATAQALAQLAAQALVKSLFYTAEGFAALAGFAYGPASQYFEAAGVMAAVGAAAGVTAHALSGGSASGSSNTQQTNSNTSSTGNQAGGRVNQFGDGALVSSPTLAMIGERAGETEAVLPLDHPSSMQRIGQAIAAAGGSGSGRGIHVHVAGMISDDNLSNVIKKIDRKVRSGGASLTSSNSLRTTKRSL